MEEVKLNITTENDTVTILTGEAEKIVKPLKVEIEGTIDAASEYYLKRKENIIPSNSRLEVDRANRSIKLIVGENFSNNIVVIAKAKFNNDFLDFTINQKKQYSVSELRDVLKHKGIYFIDRDTHLKVIGNLVNYNAKITTEFSQSNDFKGNAATSKATQLKSEFPLDFKLRIPVLLGQPAIDIDVEVCIDALSGTVKMWLESVNLKEQVDAIINNLIDSEIAKFKNELVVINVG